MGHVRLGRLPRKHGWKDVCEALQAPRSSLSDIVKLTANASEKVLLQSKNTEGLSECFWTFSNIIHASCNDGFVSELNALGIPVREDDSGISTLKKI